MVEAQGIILPSFRLVNVEIGSTLSIFVSFKFKDVKPVMWVSTALFVLYFVLKFMDTVNLKDPIMIGHSHGGRVILKMAAEKLVNPPKIVLLDSAGLIPKKTMRQKLRLKSFKTIKRVLTLPVIKIYSGSLLEKARNHYGSADYNAAPEVLRKTLVSLVNTDLRDIVHNISCPTLLIWGEKDTDTPLESAKILESLIKDAGLCVYENAGHFAFFEQIGKTIAILNSFIK